MDAILLVVHVVLAVLLIGLVLLQRGKGAEVGAGFGRGASGTVFGASGSASFLTKLTTLAAILFFGTSLSLAYLASHRQQDAGLLQQVKTATTGDTDSVPAPVPPGETSQRKMASDEASDVPPVEKSDAADVPPVEQ